MENSGQSVRDNYLSVIRTFIEADTYEPLFLGVEQTANWQSFIEDEFIEDDKLLREKGFQKSGHVYWDTQRMHAFMWAAGKASNWDIDPEKFPFEGEKSFSYRLKHKPLQAWIERTGYEKPAGTIKSESKNIADLSYDLAILVHYILRDEAGRKRVHENQPDDYARDYLSDSPSPDQPHFKSLAEQVLAHLVCPQWFDSKCTTYDTERVIGSMNSREKNWLEKVLKKVDSTFDIKNPNWAVINGLEKYKH